MDDEFQHMWRLVSALQRWYRCRYGFNLVYSRSMDCATGDEAATVTVLLHALRVFSGRSDFSFVLSTTNYSTSATVSFVTVGDGRDAMRALGDIDRKGGKGWSRWVVQ